MSNKVATDLLDKLYLDMPLTPDASEPPVSHYFASGVYVRRSVIPEGATIRVHVHTYDHITILASGRGRLLTDEGSRDVKAGECIEVKAGVRHAYRADEATVWFCVHSEKAEEARELYGGRG